MAKSRARGVGVRHLAAVLSMERRIRLTVLFAGGNEVPPGLPRLGDAASKTTSVSRLPSFDTTIPECAEPELERCCAFTFGKGMFKESDASRDAKPLCGVVSQVAEGANLAFKAIVLTTGVDRPRADLVCRGDACRPIACCSVRPDVEALPKALMSLPLRSICAVLSKVPRGVRLRTGGVQSRV